MPTMLLCVGDKNRNNRSILKFSHSGRVTWGWLKGFYQKNKHFLGTLRSSSTAAIWFAVDFPYIKLFSPAKLSRPFALKNFFRISTLTCSVPGSARTILTVPKINRYRIKCQFAVQLKRGLYQTCS